eukprot:121351-Rhodomonas_salina.2
MLPYARAVLDTAQHGMQPYATFVPDKARHHTLGQYTACHHTLGQDGMSRAIQGSRDRVTWYDLGFETALLFSEHPRLLLQLLPTHTHTLTPPLREALCRCLKASVSVCARVCVSVCAWMFASVSEWVCVCVCKGSVSVSERSVSVSHCYPRFLLPHTEASAQPPYLPT